MNDDKSTDTHCKTSHKTFLEVTFQKIMNKYVYINKMLPLFV